MEPSRPCVYVIQLNDIVRNDKKFLAKNPDMAVSTSDRPVTLRKFDSLSTLRDTRVAST